METRPKPSLKVSIHSHMTYIHQLQSGSVSKNTDLLFLFVKADFLSSQKLLAAILLQKKSIMQVLVANILMRISIVKIVCECFLP